MSDCFINIHLRNFFETNIGYMRLTLDTLSKINLEEHKDSMGILKILDNPVEQSICNGLILSMYGNMEKCLMEIIEFIEVKVDITYNTFSKQENQKKKSTLNKMRTYIEKYSSIKINKYWMKEASYIAIIRNSVIHNGSFLNKDYTNKKKQLDKYAILEDVLGTGIITITEDLQHLYNVLEVIENLLNEILIKKIEIKTNL